MAILKPGDVFEITTKFGSAYFQFTKKISPMGSLIRIIPSSFNLDLNNLIEAINLPTNFWIFFPVSSAEKQGIIRKIGNFPIPNHAADTPLFRNGIVDRATGKVSTWWLWDGEREWKIGEINETQRKLPILGSWNDTLLIDRIENGWLPENDCR